ncbi:MAG: hypothetical protein JNM81_14105, partial [Rhodospirillaceae bacterium]|nr:hypothetical protein [Rhodospirillaceae bacterium]
MINNSEKITHGRLHLHQVLMQSVAAVALLSVPALAQDKAGDSQPQQEAQAKTEAPASKETIEQIIVTAQQAQKQVEAGGTVGVLGDLDALETPFNISTFT